MLYLSREQSWASLNAHFVTRLKVAAVLLQDLKPELVYARISGYGQTGPKSHLPGYASVCEAYGGFRYAAIDQCALCCY